MALVTVPFVLVALWRIYTMAFADDGLDLHFADLVILMGLIVCGGFAAFGLGLALRRPVGLRIDANGLSGYVSPSLTWNDIAAVEVTKFNKGHGILLKMRDPQGFLARQTGWRRFKYGLGGGKQVMLNTTYLRVRPEQIASDIEAHLKRHR